MPDSVGSGSHFRPQSAYPTRREIGSQFRRARRRSPSRSAGCGGDDEADRPTAARRSSSRRASSATSCATSSATQADVEVVMPVGADPHEFAASTRQAEAMHGGRPARRQRCRLRAGPGRRHRRRPRADGTPVFTFADHVALRTLDGDEHEHAEGEEGHDHEGGDDPHIWTDPTMIAGAVGALATELADVDGRRRRGRRAVGRAPTQRALADLDAEIVTHAGADPRRPAHARHEPRGARLLRRPLRPRGRRRRDPVADDERRRVGRRARGARRGHPRRGRAGDLRRDDPADGARRRAGRRGRRRRRRSSSCTPRASASEGSGADTYVGMLRTDAERIAEALS